MTHWTTLWLPIGSRRIAWSVTAVVTLVYLATCSRDLSLYDSAELALVAAQLGLGHPPGQPLFTLVGFVFAHLPLVPTLVGLNALSAIASGLAVFAAIALACHVAQRAASTTLDEKQQLGVASLVAIGALHAALWEPATRVEVYPLATLLSVWAVAKASTLDDAPSSGALAGIGAALGLSACSNPLVALFAGLGIGAALFSWTIRRRITALQFATFVGAGLGGVSLYLYVPLVAMRHDAFVWGRGTSLLSYFRGEDYAKNAGLDAIGFAQHLLDFALDALVRGHGVILLAGLLGYLVLLRFVRSAMPILPVATATLLTIAMVCANRIFHPQVLDYLGYLAGPMLLAVAGLAALGGFAIAHRRTIAIVGLATVLTAATLVAPPGPHARTRSSDRVVRHIAEGALREMPQGGILIAEHDHIVAPLLYLQSIERVRPDVVVIAYGLASSSFFWDQLMRDHPDLAVFALRGPGARVGRVQRLLAANRARAVAVETQSLATTLELTPCAVGYVVHLAPACSAEPDDATALLTRDRHDIGEGSPGAMDVLALVAMIRGEALARLGHTEDAYAAFLAGAPDDLASRGGPLLVQRREAMTGPMPEFRRPAPLMDPARNLYMAARIAYEAGDEAAAELRLSQAAQEGLPEALGP